MIFWPLYIPITALALIVYFYFIDWIFKGKKARFKINSNDQLNVNSRELKATLLNLVVFMAAGVLVGWIILNNVGQIYSVMNWDAKEVIYLIASFFIALGLHDIYFYWSHRFLHVKWVFKRVHSLHHKSHTVNAWSSFSFHPFEGFIQIGIVPIIACVMPIHENVLMLFTFFLLLISVYGHCGYELRPNKPNVFNVFNTSLHHYQHHKFGRYNFGIYLNVWDKMFKSGYPDYDATFNYLKKKINAKNKKPHQD